LANSDGWQQVDCNQVLYADFRVDYACENSIVYFENLSSGNIQSIEWDFGDETSSSDDNPQHSFESSGPFTINLSISDGEFEDQLSMEISLSENTLPDNNTIIENSSGLVSLKSGVSYQWFRNDNFIEGATQRTYNHNQLDGIYQVAIFDEECNILSEPFEVLTVLDVVDKGQGILYPNPAAQNLTINSNANENIQSVYVISLAGKRIPINWSQLNGELKLDISKLDQGLYIIQLRSNSKIKQYKFSKI
ncbi:MAG: T9SS type A sorting domain-containing protein, partial [Cyclobacteriaceae bacterium]